MSNIILLFNLNRAFSKNGDSVVVFLHLEEEHSKPRSTSIAYFVHPWATADNPKRFPTEELFSVLSHLFIFIADNPSSHHRY